ncbi:MAG: helix-turn-helix domain-containing protein [Lysobacteraceae bacterium]|nr:helix-turn-helix domain-containing protein [Xanthomonadales bacterium]MCP5477252.1 helix-turn-helix domain-containing protein [Rhodanobacteraceae bacterium]HPF73990.1 helix-turn-helix domain-containing protein [Xanthomonadaceae bacterium]HRY00366.1 helix-turn-helix domain-containing protein [Xanthomonadaceae bacterium]
MKYVIKHPQQLSPLLKALRTKAGFSQAKVAAKLGVTHQAVSALERHPEKATLDRLMRFLGAMDVDIVLQSRPQRQSDELTSHPVEW